MNAVFWNLDYIVPTLIIFVFLLVLYFIKPIIITRSNRCFLALVIFEILGFIMEIYTIHVDVKHAEQFPHAYMYFLNTVYLFLVMARYIAVSSFIANKLGVNSNKDVFALIVKFITLVSFIMIFTDPFTNFIYEINSTGHFIPKTGYKVFYLTCFSTVILNIYYLIRFGKRFKTKEFLIVLFTIVSLSMHVIIKIFFTNYLVTDMFFMIVMIGLFFGFENSDIYTDKETDLLNFASFSKVLQEKFIRNKRFAIITFSIKNYEEKRQIYGAKQSDLVVSQIGKFFLSLSRTRNCFYLKNGAFAIVESTDESFPKLKEIVRKRFEQPWKVNNTELHLSMISVDMQQDVYFSSYNQVLACFALAFSYVRKLTNKDSLTITKESSEKIIERTKVSVALNKALLEDSLQIYYQPIVDSKTRKIVAAEALVRIHDDELGVIPPDQFIEMAEHNGSIEQLGEQVLNKVCIYLKEKDLSQYGIKWINVNLSPIQCQNENLSEKIDKITRINNIDHKNIHLEITEESMIDAVKLKNQMDILVDNGYYFALDDFGSGFSNITRVKKFPFSNIKLDMSIVRAHFKSPDDILPSIVRSFVNKGLSVTAEGIETKEMADEMEKMGCAYLQGYYFSKPVTTDEFEKLLEK